MKISKKGEYAFLAMIALSRSFQSQELVKISGICSQYDIPKKFLEQIMIQLRTSGYIKSVRGQNGGYLLCKDPSMISVAEIIRLIDGAIAPVDSVSFYYYSPSPIEKEAKLQNLFQEIRDTISKRLENTSFADLI